MFRFKQFSITDSRSAMKLTTDAALLGAWARTEGAERVLDVGCGCGVIGLMLLQRGAGEVTGIDNHGGSLQDARENGDGTAWGARFRTVEGDATTLEGPARYDLIISNPPYFTESLHAPDEARAAARHAGQLSPERVVEIGSRLLHPGGRLAMIIPATQEQDLRKTFERYKFVIERTLRYRQRDGRPLVRTLLEATNGEAKTLEESEISLYHSDGEPTEVYRRLLHPFMLKF